MVSAGGLSSGSAMGSSMGGVNYAPSTQDVQSFQSMMNLGGPVDESLRSFVATAEDKLKVSEGLITGKLKDFGTGHEVVSLVQALHESSLRSVSVQFTGKVGSKVSESFEQLIKQQ